MLFVILYHVEIHRTVALIRESVVKNLLNELLLFDNVTRSMGFDAGTKHTELCHRLVEAIGVVLRHFHWFELLEACLLCNLVFALVGIMFEVAHIGNVTHIAHLVTLMLKVAEKEVKSNCGARMSQVCVTIYRRSANIHTYMARIDGLKFFLLTSKCIVNCQHSVCLFLSFYNKSPKGMNF